MLPKELQESFNVIFVDELECKWPNCGSWPDSCNSEKCRTTKSPSTRAKNKPTSE